MSITAIRRVLTTPHGEPWLEQAYSSDASAAPEVLKAAVAGVRHFITALHVTYAPGSTAKWWVLVDNNESEIAPRIDATDDDKTWYHIYREPLPCEVGHAVRILTEATGQVSVVMEGASNQSDPFNLESVLQASSSVSASVSASTSVSSTPSVSTSPSASISSTPSVSTSLSASISSTPSVSTSLSSSPSASISASPSQSG